MSESNVKIRTLLPPDFQPVLREWWASRFAEATDAQLDGWRAIRGGEDTLIAAPTGSGKTIAAFLTSLDQLLREGIESDLPDEVPEIYVSPLRVLSAAIQKNLRVPSGGIPAFFPVKKPAPLPGGAARQNIREPMWGLRPSIMG